MLKLTVGIFAFLLASCVAAAPRTRHPRLNGRIIGGVNANISEIPYQLSLEYDGNHICGAAIIHELFAVTAAHCVYGLPTSLIRFRAGSSMRGDGGSLHPVEEVLLHPDYKYLSIEYDVAVVLVSVPFVLGDNVQPIPIANLEPAHGTMALVSGWGVTELEGPLSSQLQKAMVSIIDQDACNKAYFYWGGVTENMICAGGEEGRKDSCVGDTGGPLVVGEQLVGIVSLGLSCGIWGLPGIYTNLPVLSQELRKIVHNHPRFHPM